MIEAVIFDLDGVVIDSEQIWDEERERYVRAGGGRYDAEAQRAMMGMSSIEWSRYIHEELGLPRAPAEINDDVVALMIARYEADLPLVPGAREAIERTAARWPLAVASSSNRVLIEAVLRLGSLEASFRATVSSEEVPRGKPAPDVFVEAARRLGVDPARCAAIEDSHSGIRAARAAAMRVVAIPNPHYPPGADALEHAHVVLRSIAELTGDVIAG